MSIIATKIATRKNCGHLVRLINFAAPVQAFFAMTKMFIVLGLSTVFLLFILFVDAKNPVDAETAERWHKDSKNWKLGIFYFNPDDKRLLPPKRWKGMGWTINFGNPYSILGILALLGIIVGLEYLL